MEKNDELQEESQDEQEETQESEETTEEKIDWKAKAEEQEGIAKRNYAKLKKAEEKLETLKKESSAEAPEKKEKSGDLDYGQLAYLAAKGIESDEEIGFITKIMGKTGEDLKTTLQDEYVSNRLKSIREQIVTKKATPSNSKRGTPSGRDTVEYWLAKGEYPPYEQKELRRKVLAAEMKKAVDDNKFTDRPVVG